MLDKEGGGPAPQRLIRMSQTGLIPLPNWTHIISNILDSIHYNGFNSGGLWLAFIGGESM